jgi:hypothetical protein
MAKKAFVYDGTQWVDIAQSTTDLSNYAYIPSTQFSFRNKIINGDFRINQRAYVSAANLASDAYGFDRWKSNFTNTTLTFTSAPQGQILTINSGGGVEQVIERENMPAGTYVLSWTGTATGRVYNTGATPPSYAASPITVTLDGTANVEVEFTASGGTRTLQNVQLEAGSIASAFEQRPIGTELALCQRYYWRTIGNGNAFVPIGIGFADNTTTVDLIIRHPVTMRAAPANSAFEFSGLRITDYQSVFSISSVQSNNSGTRNNADASAISFRSTGLTAFRPYAVEGNNNVNAYFAINAEL